MELPNYVVFKEDRLSILQIAPDFAGFVRLPISKCEQLPEDGQVRPKRLAIGVILMLL
jgi:hypothetical protein